MRWIACALVCATLGCQTGGSRHGGDIPTPSFTMKSRTSRYVGSIVFAFLGVVLTGAAIDGELKSDDKPVGTGGRIGIGAAGVGLVVLAYVVWPPSESEPVETVKPVDPRSALPVALDRQAIATAMGTVDARIRECGRERAGRVELAITVSPEGAVVDAAVRAASDPSLGACVAERVRAAVFAPTQRGGTFKMPYDFAATAQ